jgi:glycosyltransferase involved in cell wall biosynthesis
MRIGIGVATYNRSGKLAATLENLCRNTPPDIDIVIADDGSTDDTSDVIASYLPRIRGVVQGANHGAAWNKNRLLYFFERVCKTDVTIILEDDTYPVMRDWEKPWVTGALRLGHVGYAGSWFANSFIRGAGTPDAPYESCNTTAQCAAFSWYALSQVGYMDSRFGKLGAEHVEHSMRFVRAGFGGYSTSEESFSPMYYLLNGNFVVSADQSFFTDQEKIEQSIARLRDLVQGPDYRPPWSNLLEATEFRAEIERADTWASSGATAVPGHTTRSS